MSTEPTTIRWEQDETGVVTLVLDDPNQSANTMNQAFRASLAAVTDRLEAEKDSIRGVIFTSAKKTFFAGGDLRDLIRVTPRPPRTSSTAASPSSGTCAASRPWASRSSPPSTARRWAAASSSPSPATTGSPSTPPAPRSAAPRSPSACSPEAAESSAPCACWASPTPC